MSAISILDWYVRIYAPGVLRLAGLAAEAALLEGLPPLTPDTLTSADTVARGVLLAAQEAVHAAYEESWWDMWVVPAREHGRDFTDGEWRRCGAEVRRYLESQDPRDQGLDLGASTWTPEGQRVLTWAFGPPRGGEHIRGKAGVWGIARDAAGAAAVAARFVPPGHMFVPGFWVDVEALAAAAAWTAGWRGEAQAAGSGLAGRLACLAETMPA